MRSRRLHATGDLIADRYEILDFAGEGGMQEFYLAQDLHLKRRVAVKTPKNASADKRFERSAIVSAKGGDKMLSKLLKLKEMLTSLSLLHHMSARGYVSLLGCRALGLYLVAPEVNS